MPLIHASQLRRARETIALSAEDVSAQLGVPVNQLKAWESGKEEPPLEVLESLAATYGRAVDYFLSESNEGYTEVFFRTSRYSLPSQLSLAARQVIAQFEELCRFEWEIQKLAGESMQPSFPRFSNGRSGDELAEMEREALGLGQRPISNLRDFLNEIGVRVFVLAVPDDAFSGLSWWHSEYGPGLLVNGLESAGRRSFTMAHEFGHLVNANGNLTVCDLSEIEEERKANRFAVSFLLPEEDLKHYWDTHARTTESIDVDFLAIVAKRYSVSLEALAIRLEELELLPSAKWLIENAPKPRTYGRRKPDWRRTRGERFVRAAVAVHKNGQLSLGKLAQYLGVDVRTARQVADQE